MCVYAGGARVCRRRACMQAARVYADGARVCRRRACMQTAPKMLLYLEMKAKLHSPIELKY